MVAIGDTVERALRFFGITEKRVNAMTGKKDCGCSRRKSALNEVGYRWQRRLRFPQYWLQESWRKFLQTQAGTRLYLAAHHLFSAFRVLLFGR
jgi:hypothetical protein